MKTAERDGLLLLLAAASGSADGWSYFGMGHAFVANMTGNTVMIGISVFHSPASLLHPLVSLSGYLLGAVTGTLLNRRIPQGSLWTRSVSWTLFPEALLMIFAESVWLAVHARPGPELELVLLSLVAVAIGLQSGAMVQLRVPGVVTTYITGTWTTLTGGLTLLAARQPRVMRDKSGMEERFALQAAVLGFYLLAAVCSGWAFHYQSGLVGAIPSVAVLLVAAWGALRT